MQDVQALQDVVQKNCDISDARHARDYTLCVYLLKMREYYRWEKGYPMTHALPRDDLGDWVVQREDRWEALDAEDFACVPWQTRCHDPFDAEGLNRHLLPRGLVYSAGFGRFVQPHFFLARLLRTELHDDLTVYIADREYARDLSAPPAMLQGRTVFIRRESLRRMVWEKIEDWRWRRRPDDAMGRALACHDFERDTEDALERMTDQEVQAAMLHELGEGAAGRLLGGAWSEMLAGVARSPVEIRARAVRDLLADCLVTLPRLLERGAEPSLHFYFANFRGLRAQYDPALTTAYQAWVDGRAERPLRDAVARGRDHWLGVARALLSRYADGAGQDPAGLGAWLDGQRRETPPGRGTPLTMSERRGQIPGDPGVNPCLIPSRPTRKPMHSGKSDR